MRTKPQKKPKTRARNNAEARKATGPAPATTSVKKVKGIASESTFSAVARNGSKLQMCLDLLGRRDGATLDDLSSATGWQPHSVRGFLSGTVKKKLGLSLDSARDSDGVRRYHLAPSNEDRR